MAATVPPSHWTPQDDLLLKNSVEAGASLESLAKGAVRFSRGFTIEEIQERWYSILYNPIVSEEASHRMTEIELAKFHQSNSRPSKAKSGKEITHTSAKRKTETIRESYYAMRKRICNVPFDLCGLDNYSFGDGNLSSAHCLISNPFPNDMEIQGNDVQFGGKNISQNLQESIAITGDPGFGPSNPLPFCNSFAVECLQNDGNAMDLAGPSFDGFMPPQSSDANVEGPLRYGGPPSNAELDRSMACDGLNHLPPSTGDHLAELSNALLSDSTIDDELFLDNSYLDSLSLLLLDSTNQDDFPAAVAAARAHITGATGAHSAGPADVALHRCDEKKLPGAPLTYPVLSFRYLGPEYGNGVICCTLNTEDPEIPNNDDVFILTGPSNLAPSSNARKSTARPPINKQKDACAPSGAIGSSHPSGSGSRYPTGDHMVRFGLPKSNIQSASMRNENLTTQRKVVSKPDDKPDASDQEEMWPESESDVPYFSDIEEMILDMDLSPEEYDLNANPEVQRYQHEETKRTIIRLEQGANSCMQRAIAAQGALAVLYSRCSKHFIKKSEVLLGRTTEDFEGVDIDLGRERNGAKISRRQAIIKMDMHGAFHLQNIGKSSVYVNGKEVATGQNLPLISGCLIEVRGLSFVFETNHARVQQHVRSIMGGDPFLDHRPSIQM